MANPVGNVVSRLIRDRSYAGGELERIERRLEVAAANLRAARATHSAAKREQQVILQRLKELDGEIAERSAVRIADIRARVATPKRYTVKWGSQIAELVRFLKAADGEPLTTAQIVDHLVSLYGLPLGTVDERRYARKWVTSKLQHLARRGAIERLHDTNDNLLGLWLWVGI